MLSGEVLGRDTREAIEEVGRKYGFYVLADGLSVMYRIPGEPFFVERVGFDVEVRL